MPIDQYLRRAMRDTQAARNRATVLAECRMGRSFPRKIDKAVPAASDFRCVGQACPTGDGNQRPNRQRAQLRKKAIGIMLRSFDEVLEKG